jgi:mannan endo-1,4-beta-mannosidase
MRHQGRRRRGKSGRVAAIVMAIIVVAAIAVGVVVYKRSSNSPGPLPVSLPPASGSYLGVFAKGAPGSYSGITNFASATGSSPDVVMYYSGWYMPFPTNFANTAANNGAAPLVQMDPTGISLAAIAAGKYDGYLSAYAEAVREYRDPVILSFAHEMNGNWYSWGYTKTSPKVFIAAWRHIVTLFRALGAKNVTWLWTVNIINNTQSGKIPSPVQWWPGNQYVNWVGIDGYYLKPTWQFAPLFGPTIGVIQTNFPGHPILIAETGAVPAAGQSAKISDLFLGIHTYGLLGFVWYDTTNKKKQNFGINDNPSALAAFRKGASTYKRPGT